VAGGSSGKCWRENDDRANCEVYEEQMVEHSADVPYLASTRQMSHDNRSERLAAILKSKGKGSSITQRRVPEVIPVFGSQPAGDVSHKPDGRLPVLFARPAVTLATLKRAATNFAAW